jgi:hypothetical protein
MPLEHPYIEQFIHEQIEVWQRNLTYLVLEHHIQARRQKRELSFLFEGVASIPATELSICSRLSTFRTLVGACLNLLRADL